MRSMFSSNPEPTDPSKEKPNWEERNLEPDQNRAHRPGLDQARPEEDRSQSTGLDGQTWTQTRGQQAVSGGEPRGQRDAYLQLLLLLQILLLSFVFSVLAVAQELLLQRLRHVAPPSARYVMVGVGGGGRVHEEEKRVSAAAGVQACGVGKGQGQGQSRHVLTGSPGRRRVPVLRLASSSAPNMDTPGREDRGRGEGTAGDRARDEEEEGEQEEEGDVSISAGPLE